MYWLWAPATTTLAMVALHRLWLRGVERVPDRVPFPVSVVVPALNEEDYIRACLGDLLAQERVGAVEVLVVDSASEDRTARLTKEMGVRVLQAPRGKLTARTVGIRAASSDIVVAADADTRYPRYWLAHLVAPFRNPAQVATAGPALNTIDSDKAGLAASVGGSVVHWLRGSLPGCNSAVRREAFLAVGGFPEADQTDFYSMTQAELVGLGQRLHEVGKVTFVHQAVVFTSGRRLPWTRSAGRTRLETQRKAGVRF